MIEIACINFTGSVSFKNFNHRDINITYFNNTNQIRYNEFSIIFLINDSGYNALEIIKHIRASFSNIIYFIDLEYNEKIMVDLFLNGINDYMIAPIYPQYLINKIIHDTKILCINTSINYNYKTLEVDYKNYRALIDNVDINLTIKEYLILELLVKNVNNVVTKQVIIRTVWGDYNESYLQTLDTHIKTLRKKLNTYRDNVVTLWNRGYAFMERK
jgi:DNA-binding response OmpR family regulator